MSKHDLIISSANISAANFNVTVVDESRVLVTITDLLSASRDGKKQLTLRDILKNDLKYKISYHRFGNTGKVQYQL